MLGVFFNRVFPIDTTRTEEDFQAAIDQNRLDNFSRLKSFVQRTLDEFKEQREKEEEQRKKEEEQREEQRKMEEEEKRLRGCFQKS